MGGHFRLVEGYQVHCVDGLGVFFLSERRQWMTTSKLMLGLCPHLGDGGTIDGLIRAVAPAIGPAEVHFALQSLFDAGVVADGAPVPRAPPEPAAWRTARIGSHEIALLSLVGTGDTSPAELLSRALVEVGGSVGPWQGEEPARGGQRICLALVHDPLTIDRTLAGRLSARWSWAPVKLSGQQFWFGPLMSATATRWCDLREALAQNRPLETFLRRRTDHSFVPGGRQPAAPASDAPEAARAMAERLAAGATVSEVFSAGPLEWVGKGAGFRQHPAPSRRRTPRPGAQGAGVANANAIRLESDLPVKRGSGGYRVLSAEQALDRLLPLVGNLTGAIAEEYPLPAAPGCHVHAAAYLTVPREADPAPDAFQGIALGKGRDARQARISALAEAVERLSAQWHDDVPVLTATRSELGEAALGPDVLWNFSAAQYAARERINAMTADERRHVPPPLPIDQPIQWTSSWSLTDSAPRWVPREHDRANAPGRRFGRYNPNGCASGACLEEAVLQGVLELVERDAVAIWWYNRLRKPGIRPEDLPDPDIRQIVQGIKAKGWKVWLLDLTTDLGIPAVTALARAGNDGRWCVGFGAHFEAELAAERAITELAQLFRVDGRDGPPPWRIVPGIDEGHLFPGTAGALPENAPVPACRTLAELVGACVTLLANHGHEMLVTDLSRPELKLRVAKVTVPGLRHFWPRFGSGRLYDVPLRMGWQQTPTSEADLNPISLFV